jgi:Mrp family chromosome partitioning ATPase
VSEGVETLKAVVRRSLPIVVVGVAAAAVAMNIVQHALGAQYRAKARVVLSPVDVASVAAGISQYVDPALLDATERTLADAPQLYDEAAARTGGELGTGSDLRDVTTATKSGGTITFGATASNGKRAVAIANDVATTYRPWRARIASAGIARAIAQVQRELAAAPGRDPNLADQLARLRSLKYLAGNVLLVERASAAERTRPRPVRDSILGGFIGLFVALLVVAAREAIDTRVRSEGEVEDLLDVPVLGSVEALRRRSGLVALGRHTRYGDMYGVLAVNLLHIRSGATSTVIAVTSATAEEGKTTTAANVAAALALRGANVILVDGDSRKPSVATVFDIPDDSPGIEELIERGAATDEALWTVTLNGGGDLLRPPAESAGGTPPAAGAGSLRVLPKKRINPKGDRAANARAMSRLIATLRPKADYVIIDMPPALSVPDVTEVSRLVDMILIVVRYGGVSRRTLAALTRVRRNWPHVNVAAVFVGAPRQEDAYSYYAAR